MTSSSFTDVNSRYYISQSKLRCTNIERNDLIDILAIEKTSPSYDNSLFLEDMALECIESFKKTKMSSPSNNNNTMNIGEFLEEFTLDKILGGFDKETRRFEDNIIVRSNIKLEFSDSGDYDTTNKRQSRKKSVYPMSFVLKFYGTPTNSLNGPWYEGLMYRFIIPKLYEHTPHLSRATTTIFNVKRQDLQKSLSTDSVQPTSIDKTKKKPSLLKLLNDHFDDLNPEFYREIKVKKDGARYATIGVTIMTNINKFQQMTLDYEISKEVGLVDVLANPRDYLLPVMSSSSTKKTNVTLLDETQDLHEIKKNFYAILFNILYTFECMNRFDTRHNDPHLGNVQIVIYKEPVVLMYKIPLSEMEDSNFIFDKKKTDRLHITKSHAVPYLIDFDRSWSKHIKIPNISIKNEDDKCISYGQCSRTNPNHDTGVFLLSIYKNLFNQLVDMKEDNNNKKPVGSRQYNDIEFLLDQFKIDIFNNFFNPIVIPVIRRKRLEDPDDSPEFWNFPFVNKNGVEIFDSSEKYVHGSTLKLLQMPIFDIYFGSINNVNVRKNTNPLLRQVDVPYVLPAHGSSITIPDNVVDTQETVVLKDKENVLVPSYYLEG